MKTLRTKVQHRVINKVLLAAAILLSGTQVLVPAQEAGVEVRQVRAEKLGNVPGKTLTAITVSYAPGGKSSAHHHAGAVFAYVLSGAIRSEVSANGPAKVYKAGESFFEPPGSQHLVSENASATEPASLLAVFVAGDGAQLTMGELTRAAAAITTPPPHSTPSEFVDALNLAFGKQMTGRATHAKGIVLRGTFTPSPAAAALSKAAHFRESVPVTIRFSDNTGIPKLADNAPLASPHGMALKFHLPDGTETDLVTHSYNGFPAPNSDEMRQFFIAVGTSGPGVASPKPIEKYVAAHPAAKAFLTMQDPPPISYATLAYFGVNSFKFANAEGKATIGRYRIEPQAGKQFLSKEDAAKAAPDYLSDEIRRRVAKEPVRFTLKVQLPEAGDVIDDPSIAWPDDRRTVEIGMLEITSVVPDSDATDRGLLFVPSVLPDSIEAADPMIKFRGLAYPVSYDRRHQ